MTSTQASISAAAAPTLLCRLVLPLGACVAVITTELGQIHCAPGAFTTAAAHSKLLVVQMTPEFPLAAVPQVFTLPDSQAAREVKHGWPDAVSTVYGAPSAAASGDRGQ